MTVPLLEREGALLDLGEGLERARQGNGVVALIRGEAGIGKTALVRAFVAGIGDRAHVLSGSCDDLTTARPLGPLWDMAIGNPELEAALAGGDRNRVFQHVRDCLMRGLRPTVMVIEDVQWADDATLDLIRFVGRRVEGTHGLVILTYRDEETGGDNQVRRTLGDFRADMVVRIRLDPLSRGAMAAMAGSEDVDEIAELTRGNPFLITELLANDGDAVPQSITDSVQARLSRLDPDARRLVDLVSVVPGQVELSLLTALLGDISVPLVRSEERGLLEPAGDTVRFRHELARRAVEASLSGSARRDLNSQILGGLGQSDLARLAHHAREAGDIEAILRILPEAARQADAVGSHHQAALHIRALEPYLDHLDRDQLEAHFDLWTRVAHLVGDPEALAIADRAVALRRQSGDRSALTKALLEAAGVAWSAPSADAVDARFEQAVDVLEGVGGEEEAALYATAARLALSRYELRARPLAERALFLNGDERNVVRVQALSVVGGAVSTTYPEGIAELTEAHDLAQELGLAYEGVRTATSLCSNHYKNMELDGARDWASVALGLCDDAEYPELRHACTVYLAAVSLYRGEYAEVERLASTVVDLESASWGAKQWAESLLAHVMLRQGATGARSRVLELWNRAMELGHLTARGPTAVVLGELAWLEGEVDPGARHEMVSLVNETLTLRMKWPAALHAVWLVLGGWMDGVQGEIATPYRQLIDGDWEAAAVSFEHSRMPYEQSVALSLGSVDARIAALRILDDLGARPLAAKIRRGLAAEGVKGVPRGPYRGRRESPIGLTPRQTEILDLVAEGMTNSEIADRLFLSVRTVEHHVSAVINTLGASTRAEAVRLSGSTVDRTIAAAKYR